MNVPRRQIDVGAEPEVRAVDAVSADDDGESELRVGVVEFLEIEVRMADLESQHGVAVRLADNAGLAE